MDPCDQARHAADQWLADCIARRTGVGIQPKPDGEPIPANRLATGAGTCIDCQIRIERGDFT